MNNTYMCYTNIIGQTYHQLSLTGLWILQILCWENIKAFDYFVLCNLTIWPLIEPSRIGIHSVISFLGLYIFLQPSSKLQTYSHTNIHPISQRRIQINYPYSGCYVEIIFYVWKSNQASSEFDNRHSRECRPLLEY